MMTWDTEVDCARTETVNSFNYNSQSLQCASSYRKLYVWSVESGLENRHIQWGQDDWWVLCRLMHNTWQSRKAKLLEDCMNPFESKGSVTWEEEVEKGCKRDYSGDGQVRIEKMCRLQRFVLFSFFLCIWFLSALAKPVRTFPVTEHVWQNTDQHSRGPQYRFDSACQ